MYEFRCYTRTGLWESSCSPVVRLGAGQLQQDADATQQEHAGLDGARAQHALAAQVGTLPNAQQVRVEARLAVQISTGADVGASSRTGAHNHVR